MARVVVVGGGISGLAAGFYLSQAGHECTLVESRPWLGGVIRSERLDGCLVEAGPDSFVAQKPGALQLIRELGIADQIIGSNDHLRKVYIARGGRLIPMPTGIHFMIPTQVWPMVKTPLLSWGAKIRIGLEYFRRPQGPQTDRSIAAFVNDHYGTEVLEYLAQPMLAGVYGGPPEKLSINSALPRIVEAERRYGSITRAALSGALANHAGDAQTAGRELPGSLFLSLQGGMQQLVDALLSRLEKQTRFITGTATSVEGSQGQFEVTVGGDRLSAEEVVLATAGYQAADLLRPLDARLADLLGGIPYNSSVTAALVYDRQQLNHPLQGFGLLTPRREGRRITACTWVNTKFAGRAPDDKALLRVFLGAEQAERVRGLPDEDVARQAHEELSALMGFQARPISWKVHRWEKALPQYEVGHQKLENEIDGRLKGLPGLHLAGNAYSGLGIPDCILRSRRVADRVAATVRS